MSSDELIPVSDEVHEHHCEIANCKHPAVYDCDDGTTAQGWCARCRAVAYGGVYEGVTFRGGRIIDADTGKSSTRG